jgi:vacuolar-type H+-ATPase subunit H
MHQASEHPEFMRTIKEIRDAEEEYDRLIHSAKERADKIMREAKERIQAEHMKSEEEAVSFKDERIRKGNKEIDSEVGNILGSAKDEAGRIGKKKADSQTVSRLVKDFLGSL